MSSNNDDGPDTLVSIEIGVCGLILFLFTLIFCILAFLCSRKHRFSKRIFGFAILMCLFELPRCIVLIIDGNYHSKISYVLHMIANLFFFMSFTFVCFLLHEAVDLSKTTSPLRTKLYKISRLETVLLTRNSLYATNLLFAILIVITSVFCLLSSSLFSFFRDNIMYKIYTYFDVLKNLIYSFALLYFGCKLRKRITGFSKQMNLTNQAPTTTAMIGGGGGGSDANYNFSESLILQRLEFAVRKLILVMSICIVSFTLRSIMLILKLLVVEYNLFQLDDFQIYGKDSFCFVLIVLLSYLLVALRLLLFLTSDFSLTIPFFLFSLFRDGMVVVIRLYSTNFTNFSICLFFRKY
jgi:hypothetical protein